MGDMSKEIKLFHIVAETYLNSCDLKYKSYFLPPQISHLLPLLIERGAYTISCAVTTYSGLNSAPQNMCLPQSVTFLEIRYL